MVSRDSGTTRHGVNLFDPPYGKCDPCPCSLLHRLGLPRSDLVKNQRRLPVGQGAVRFCSKRPAHVVSSMLTYGPDAIVHLEWTEALCLSRGLRDVAMAVLQGALLGMAC